MKKAIKFLDMHFERVCMGILLVIMFVVVLLGIITRLAGSPISWTEEASRLCVDGVFGTVLRDEI